jgi:hypothetical protein
MSYPTPPAVLVIRREERASVDRWLSARRNRRRARGLIYIPPTLADVQTPFGAVTVIVSPPRNIKISPNRHVRHVPVAKRARPDKQVAHLPETSGAKRAPGEPTPFIGAAALDLGLLATLGRGAA